MEERKNSTKRFIIECCLFIIGLTIFEILVTKTFVNNYVKELTNAKLAILIIAATLGAIVYTVTVLLGWRCVLCLKVKKYKETIVLFLIIIAAQFALWGFMADVFPLIGIAALFVIIAMVVVNN